MRSALWLEERQQGPQRLGAIADELDLHRVAQAEHPRVDVNLDAPGLALLREELGVGEPGANHQQGVAAGHHVVAGRRPQPTDGAGDERQVVRQRGFAEEGLGHARTEDLSGLDDFRAGAQCPGADQDGNALPRVQHLGRAAQIIVLRHDARWRIADRPSASRHARGVAR